MTASRLRLISITEPSPPRRILITISARDERVPFGKSRVFRLRAEHLAELLSVAQRLEARQ